MARQEELMAQTIANMKRAMLRKADDSESDHSIKGSTNRGNKLKRKAKYVEEGKLDLANSFRANKRRINYNGYFREIISRNPLRVDPDGDVVDNDEEDSALELEDFDEDPYSQVHIEKLLMPLTSAANLKTHPTLSYPYTSKVLDEMLQSARDMVFREEEALWRIKTLFQEFRGDSTWMPVGDFETDHDFALLGSITATPSVAPSVTTAGQAGQSAIAQWDPISDGPHSIGLEEGGTDQETNHTDASDGSALLTESYPHDAYESSQLNPENHVESDAESKPAGRSDQRDEHQNTRDPSAPTTEYDQVNGELNNTSNELNGILSLKQEEDTVQAPASADNKSDLNATNESHQPLAHVTTREGEDTAMKDSEDQHTTQDGGDHENPDNGEDPSADEAAQPPHRMTTRAKAQAATSPNPDSPTNASTPHFIHPFFLPPRSAISTREFGLPYDEADETRRLLWAYVQKQEEACRAANRICSGLLKAKRLRDEVLEWCQAEGHIGELSDGEDWYDREKWGLETDLKKGEEQDEEDTTATGKKTRHRRTARDA